MTPSRRLASAVGTTLFAVTLIMPLVATGAAPDSSSGVALMRLNFIGPPSEIPLPVHAVMQDAGGVDYALVLAPEADGLALGAIMVDPLASPARIVATVDGREQVIALEARPTITEATPWRVAFRGEATGAGLLFTSTGWVEQDGFGYIELSYAPEHGRPVTVEGLRLEFHDERGEG